MDEARIAFDDANVPGAQARATAKGDLDILFPAFTTFRGFDVNVAQLDLRTLVYLNPNFPRVPTSRIVMGRASQRAQREAGGSPSATRSRATISR